MTCVSHAHTLRSRCDEQGHSIAASADPGRGAEPADLANWARPEWWDRLIDAACDGADPALCNLRITLAHGELSRALQRITGPQSGANFHTWAVWGSKKAGRTIRREDVSLLAPRDLAGASALGAVVAGGVARGGVARRAMAAMAAGAVTRGALGLAASALLDRAAEHIFAGNVTVLTDIGRQTARFVSAFHAAPDRSQARLDEFLAGLTPGRTADGGQDLLREAYRCYFAAGCEADADRRDELMLCANLHAILHEHQRLEPYIDGSVPPGVRRFVTAHLLSFSLGSEGLRVSRDVPVHDVAPFPPTLRTIELPELKRFLDGPQGWDRTPDSLTGSAAGDWTKLADRMNFIVDLFRSRQADAHLFEAPFSPGQQRAILAGRMPAGPL